MPRDGQYPYPDPSILTPSVDFTTKDDGDMSVMSDGMPRMSQRNGVYKNAETQTDDELLLSAMPKEPVS